jgi:ribosome-binding factor A
MPEMEFKIDESYEHTKKISDILEQIKKEKHDAAGDRGDQKV